MRAILNLGERYSPYCFTKKNAAQFQVIGFDNYTEINLVPRGIQHILSTCTQ